MKYVNTLEEAEELIGIIDNNIIVHVIEDIAILRYSYGIDNLHNGEGGKGGCVVIINHYDEMNELYSRFEYLESFEPEIEEYIMGNDGKKYGHLLFVYSMDFSISVYIINA